MPRRTLTGRPLRTMPRRTLRGLSVRTVAGRTMPRRTLPRIAVPRWTLSRRTLRRRTLQRGTWAGSERGSVSLLPPWSGRAGLGHLLSLPGCECAPMVARRPLTAAAGCNRMQSGWHRAEELSAPAGPTRAARYGAGRLRVGQ